MPLPNTIEAYEDVRIILDAVLAQGGGSYMLPSPRDAQFWRKRAYKFRKLASQDGENKYNALVLRMKDNCTISFDQNNITGTLLSPEGYPVDPLGAITDDWDIDIGDIVE